MKLDAPYDKYQQSIELIDALLILRKTYKEVYADKKVKWTEYLTIVKAAFEAKDGFIGMEKIPAEWKQEGALKDLSAYFKKVYDDPNDELEDIIEDIMDLVIEGYMLEQRIEKFLKGSKQGS